MKNPNFRSRSRRAFTKLPLIRPLLRAPFVAPPRSGLGAKKGPLCTFLVLPLLLLVSGVRADDDDCLDSKKAREQQEMRDFLGAVYKGQGALNITSGTLAQGSEGAIVRTGNTFTTPRGVYVKCGNSWLLPNGQGAVVSTGKTFLSPDGAIVKTGTTYLGSEGNAVAAGQAVFRNYPKTKKEDAE